MFGTWIEETIGLPLEAQPRVWLTLVVLLFIWIVYRVALLLIGRRVRDAEVAYRWHKSAGYLAWFSAALLLVRVWFDDFGSLATYLGLVSAGVAIALQSLLQNLAGWLFIVLRRPFQVGDRIEINEIVGDVIDLRPFQFSLLEVGNWVGADQSSGRIIHVPNGLVFTHAVANYTSDFDFIWIELVVLLTFESDWAKARELVTEIAKRHAVDAATEAKRQISNSHRFFIRYSKLTPTVYLSVRDSGVELSIRTLCEPRKRRDLEQVLWEDILLAFAAHDDIDFAYPTVRVFDDAAEGIGAARRNARSTDRRKG